MHRFTAICKTLDVFFFLCAPVFGINSNDLNDMVAISAPRLCGGASHSAGRELSKEKKFVLIMSLRGMKV